MAPTTRDAQRAELQKIMWRVANDLRGSIDFQGIPSAQFLRDGNKNKTALGSIIAEPEGTLS